MSFALSIKQKLYFSALATTVLLLGVSYTGYWGIQQLSGALRDTAVNAAALSNQADADSMISALRTDALNAVVLSDSSSTAAADKRERQTKMTDHIQKLHSSLEHNDALPLKSDIKNALTDLHAPVDSYIKKSQDLVGLALKDAAAARQQLSEFTAEFHAIETQTGQLGDRFDHATAEDNANAQALMSTATRMIVVVSSLAVLIVLLLAWLIPAYIIKSLGQISTVAATAARGNLTVRSTHAADDEIGQLGSAVNTMLGDFQDAIGQITGSATQLAAAAEEMSAITEQTTHGVKQQRGEIDQVATAMNEMTATVQEVARNAEQAAHAAQDADQSAKSGALVASEAMGGIDALVNEVEKSAAVIHELEAESENIGAVLDVIKGIAEQTNLLALNAAIEAARAGEQGRGFAVVADEVRTLASRTQKSTQEIHTMIERLQSGASNAVRVMEQARTQGKRGVEQVERTAESLASIAGAVATINDMNTQIASAAEEQSAVAEEINRNVVNISQGSAQSAQGSEQTALASQELARLASDLHTMVARFKV